MSDDNIRSHASHAHNMCKIFDYVVKENYGSVGIHEKLKVAEALDDALVELFKNLPDVDLDAKADDLLECYPIEATQADKDDLQRRMLGESQPVE